MDCEESCPLPDKISTETQESLKRIHGVDILTIFSAVSFCLIMSTFTGFICFNGDFFSFKSLGTYLTWFCIGVLKNKSKQRIKKYKYIIAENIETKHKSMLEKVFYQIGKCK